MCRAGHRVVFNPPGDPDGSYIEHVQTGECMWLEEQAGLYVLNTKVAPATRQTGNVMAAWEAQCASQDKGRGRAEDNWMWNYNDWNQGFVGKDIHNFCEGKWNFCKAAESHE